MHAHKLGCSDKTIICIKTTKSKYLINSYKFQAIATQYVTLVAAHNDYALMQYMHMQCVDFIDGITSCILFSARCIIHLVDQLQALSHHADMISCFACLYIGQDLYLYNICILSQKMYIENCKLICLAYSHALLVIVNYQLGVFGYTHTSAWF